MDPLVAAALLSLMLLIGMLGLAHQIGGALGVSSGGFSVAEFGGYGPAVVLVALVVLAGGVAQLWIPPARVPEILPERV